MIDINGIRVQYQVDLVSTNEAIAHLRGVKVFLQILALI